MRRRETWLLAIDGAALVVTFVVLAASGDLRAHVPRFFAVYGAAFALYLLAVALAMRARPGEASRAALVTLLVVAALARVVLVPARPSLSDDVYRYVWEGRMVAHGVNPFAHPPDDPSLARYRDAIYQDVGHKSMATIYPPVAQGVFALAAMVHPTPTAQKATFVLFDLATILLLAPLVRARGRPALAVVVYAWNPLVIVEIAHSGHLDAVGIFFLVLGVLLLERGRGPWAALALGASFLAKYLAAVLAPFMLRRRMLPWLFAAGAVAVLGFVPFAGAGAGLFASAHTYATEWHFNGAVYEAMVSLWPSPERVRLVLALGLVAFVLVEAARRHDIVEFLFRATACGLLLAPTLYPWYVLWLVPWLCITRNRAWRAWILFTLLVVASYWVWPFSARTGRWALPDAVYAVEYVPFYALLVWDAVRGRRRMEAPSWNG